VGQDGLFAGVGDVESVEAGEPGGGHDLADGGVQLVEVETAVEVAQPELVRLVLVEGGAQRGPDADADEADEVAVHANERTR
jgi:hypothetical protein